MKSEGLELEFDITEVGWPENQLLLRAVSPLIYYLTYDPDRKRGNGDWPENS